jgi:hypothetical protein
VTDVYLPLAGTIVLAPSTLAAVLDHARGRRLDAARRTVLDERGLTADGRLDPLIEHVASTVLSGGPRCRLLSRARGRLTVVDTTLAPDSDHAAVLTRPPGSPLVHLQALSLGAATRHLARLVGLGPHVLARPPFDRPLELRDWTVVRSGFDTATPSGWVGRRDQAELHELRWVRTPGDRPATALVVARLDGGLAEVRPSESCEGAYTVTSADGRAVWTRLCALTSTRR